MLGRFQAGSVVVLVAAMVSAGGLGGCGGNKTNDELARLTGERDALREAIEREKAARDAAMAGAQSAEAEPTPVGNRPRPMTGIDDGDFGPGTTTRRDRGDLVVEVAGDVLFDSGSIVLKSSARRTLDQVARRLKGEYSGHTVRVEGYTDSDPIRKQKDKYKDNEELSAQRALAVERYLVSKGVSGRSIYSAAFGPANPKGSKRASRRVEIVILNVN